MSIVPFLRPDLDQSNERPPLLISGKLANAKPGDAYEGRLQIHNQIGACSILSVTGDALPPGSQVYVDGDEIVVAWPAYVEAAAPITNPGFEDGMAGWKGGAGWDTTTNNPITGTRSAVYYNAPGSSILSSQSRYPVNTGVPITATAAIRQGASSAGNAGAGVRLEWRDADGNLRRFKDGNMVMSASNNAVKPSSVTDYPQPGDVLVNIACHGLRKRQNREVWADTFAWDHAVAAAGINADATICITIQIRDSAGRAASWSGCIAVTAAGKWVFLLTKSGLAAPHLITSNFSFSDYDDTSITTLPGGHTISTGLLWRGAYLAATSLSANYYVSEGGIANSFVSAGPIPAAAGGGLLFADNDNFVWFARGLAGGPARSVDGLTGGSYTVPQNATVDRCYGLIATNNRVIFPRYNAAPGGIHWSSDGNITRTSVNIPGYPEYSAGLGLGFATDGTTVVLANHQPGTAGGQVRIYRSPDEGSTWAHVFTFSVVNTVSQYYCSAGFTDGVFNVVVGLGRSARSTDGGVTWTEHSFPATSADRIVGAAGQGRFVYVTAEGTAFYTDDGITYHEITNIPGAGGGSRIRSALFVE